MMNAGLRNFWKWSLLVFLAARSSDVVQSLIGLWLVPKYVPAADVGKARDAATDRFFARKQDNSTLESYTGRTK